MGNNTVWLVSCNHLASHVFYTNGILFPGSHTMTQLCNAALMPIPWCHSLLPESLCFLAGA